MSTDITTTIIPWLLGGLITLAALSAALTIYAWRESKRSPYYFLRRQAEQQMQTYSLTTIGLLMGLLFVGTYAWQSPQDNTMRMATITNAKPTPTLVNNNASNRQQNDGRVTLNPVTTNETTTATAVPQIVVLRGANSAELSLASLRELTDLQIGGPLLAPPAETDEDDIANEADAIEADVNANSNNSLEATLPPEFTGLAWTAERTTATNITPLVFSNTVDDNLNPTNPSRLFQQGSYTIYATFDYAGMRDGMSWSWVWKYNGQIISGGHELWSYGDEGPGYVFLNPEEGFSSGQYVVEIWVNEELVTQANLFVTVDAAANN